MRRRLLGLRVVVDLLLRLLVAMTAVLPELPKGIPKELMTAQQH
jgi:hypothetical protein